MEAETDDNSGIALPLLRTHPHLGSVSTENVRVTGIQNGHGRASVEFSAGGAQFNLSEIISTDPSKAEDGFFSGPFV